MLLKIRVLRNADGAPGGSPAAAEPAAADPTPAAAEPAAEPAAADPEPEPQHVPLKALTETQRKLREAREQLAYERGLREAQAAQPTRQAAAAEPQNGPPVEPKVEDFGDDWEAYQRADRQYLIDAAEYRALQKFEQRTSQHAQQLTEQQKTLSFQERLNKAAELDPDLLEVANNFHLPGPSHIPLTVGIQDAIRESDVGPQLLRYFANNKAEATRLASLSPTTALREVGRIEAAIINKPAPPVKHVTSAPEPVKPVGGVGTVEVDEDKLPMSEYMARERQKKVDARSARRS